MDITEGVYIFPQRKGHCNMDYNMKMKQTLGKEGEKREREDLESKVRIACGSGFAKFSDGRKKNEERRNESRAEIHGCPNSRNWLLFASCLSP